MQTNEEVVYLYLDDIIPNRFQPREVFDERPLKELAVSIKEHGVIQPIIVRKVNDKYEIIAGERRYKASALAGLTKIPAIVRNLDDKETSKVALLENLQRKNLNPIEEAKTYQKILELDEMTQEELAKTMGKSQSAVANKLRLLSLPEEIQEAILKENISERHARSLLNLDNAQDQKEMLKKIIDNKMTVREVEAEIKSQAKDGNNVEEENQENEFQEETMDNSQIAKDIPTAENYVPINPIMPNFDGENNDLNTPILTNIPSISEQDTTEDSQESSSEGKFINFGNIKRGQIEDDDDTDESDDYYVKNNSTVDIDNLKSNAKDLSSPVANDNQGLDSLLKINEPISTNENNSESEFKFFSPAREALKESEKEISTEDYFKSPELISVDLPDIVQTNNVDGVSLQEQKDQTPFLNQKATTINDAVEIIRSGLEKVESMGFKVEKDEINLEKSYQIVIKIEK